jgi:glycine dehydrogenase subunit 1
MSLLGKTGMRRLAEINLDRAHEAQRRLQTQAKAEAVFASPFINEFVVRIKNLDEALRRCAAQKIVPGIALEKWYPELKDCLLVCVTEMNEPEEVEALVRALAR